MRRSLALLALVAAVVAAGCGGGHDGGGHGASAAKAAYGRQLARAGQALQQTFSSIGDETGTDTSAREIGARLDRGAAALDDAARRFQAIVPPPDVRAAHAELIAGLRDLAAVFHRGADAARQRDTATMSRTLSGLATGDGVRKIAQAQRELKAKGVSVTAAG